MFKPIAITAAALLLASCSSTKALPRATVERVIDGDTVVLTGGERIRIACIDTPELRGRNTDPIGGITAKHATQQLTLGQPIRIRRITTDRYGRTVAELHNGNINIGQELVKRGYAKVMRRYAKQCSWSS